MIIPKGTYVFVISSSKDDASDYIEREQIIQRDWHPELDSRVMYINLTLRFGVEGYKIKFYPMNIMAWVRKIEVTGAFPDHYYSRSAWWPHESL